MLKSTLIGNGTNHLILIPGGPGLSSNSIRAFDPLGSDFQLHYLDFCGTNDTNSSFLNLEEICLLISSYLKKLNGKKYILGHSFGGFIASKVAIISNCSGLICIATPFSVEALTAASFSYSKDKNEELKTREDQWINNPNDQTFKNWLSEYKNLYFNDANFGKNLIQSDSVSHRFFINNRSDITNYPDLLKELSSWNSLKLFIAGEDDGLLPIDILQSDSEKGGFNFEKVEKANHFLMWDQNQQTNKIIFNFLNKENYENFY